MRDLFFLSFSIQRFNKFVLLKITVFSATVI